MELDEREKFRKYLNGNELCITIFITKARLFKKFCESLFPWLEKCLDYCMKNNLCKDYNIRLPAFLMERYSSYWFSVNTKKNIYLMQDLESLCFQIISISIWIQLKFRLHSECLVNGIGQQNAPTNLIKMSINSLTSFSLAMCSSCTWYLWIQTVN